MAKDDEDKGVVELVKKEIARIGDDNKTLYEGVQKDLTELRGKVDEGGKVAKTELDALTTSLTLKYEALDRKTSESLDRVAAAVRRANMGLVIPGLGDDMPKNLTADALSFKRQRLSVRGEAEKQSFQDLALDEKEAENYQAFCKAFNEFLRRDEKTLNGDVIKALTTGADPSGGYLVPAAMSARILTIVYETSPLAQLATVETIGSDRLEFPIDDGEGACGWVGEEEARTETATSTFGVQTIPVWEIYAKPKATQRLLEDASTDMEGWLARKNGSKMARVEATALLTGNGTKKPRGLLTYPNGTSRGQIEQVPSLGASTITADGVKRMPFYLKEPYHPNARWLTKRATLGVLAILRDDSGATPGTGQYLWTPGLRDGQGFNSTLVGYPVSLADDMPAVGANSLSMAFGDFREAYTVVRRLGITTLRDPFSSKPFVEFYSRMRVGGDVTNFEAVKLMKTAAS